MRMDNRQGADSDRVGDIEKRERHGMPCHYGRILSQVLSATVSIAAQEYASEDAPLMCIRLLPLEPFVNGTEINVDS
jgi:hypothetical protein